MVILLIFTVVGVVSILSISSILNIWIHKKMYSRNRCEMLVNIFVRGIVPTGPSYPIIVFGFAELIALKIDDDPNEIETFQMRSKWDPTIQMRSGRSSSSKWDLWWHATKRAHIGHNFQMRCCGVKQYVPSHYINMLFLINLNLHGTGARLPFVPISVVLLHLVLMRRSVHLMRPPTSYNMRLQI